MGGSLLWGGGEVRLLCVFLCFSPRSPRPARGELQRDRPARAHTAWRPGAIAAGPCLSTSAVIVSKARGIKRLNCPPHGSLGRVLSQSSSLFVPRALEPTPYMGKALSHLQRFDPEESPQLFAG